MLILKWLLAQFIQVTGNLKPACERNFGHILVLSEWGILIEAD